MWIRSKKFNNRGLAKIPGHLCNNFWSFVYTTIHHVVVQKRLNTRQHDGLVVKNCEKISAIMWVFEDVWVICAKSPFLHSLDVLIKMFAKINKLNSATITFAIKTNATATSTI